MNGKALELGRVPERVCFGSKELILVRQFREFRLDGVSKTMLVEEFPKNVTLSQLKKRFEEKLPLGPHTLAWQRGDEWPDLKTPADWDECVETWNKTDFTSGYLSEHENLDIHLSIRF